MREIKLPKEFFKKRKETTIGEMIYELEQQLDQALLTKLKQV